jgi:CRP-like cAMP-binding protein
MEVIFERLAETNIFRGLRAEDITELFDGKPFQIKQFERDQYIAHNQSVCHDMLFVLQGSVRGEMTDFSGKTIKIEDIPAPRPLAAAFIFGANNRFPVDIIANDACTILTIPRDVLIYVLQHSQIVLQNYLNVISGRSQFLSQKIRFLHFKTIKEKIAHYIVNRLGKDQQTLVLDQNQSELSDLFGVTRPSLARALSEMEEEGLIRAERKEITILDREKMNKLL